MRWKGQVICCIAVIGSIMAMQFLVSIIWSNVHRALTDRAVTADGKSDSVRVVIDAGHGGFDPGKVGVGGTLEKEINLAIAKELKELLELNGVEVVMTREDDRGLYSDSDQNKKNADMRARVQLLKDVEPVVAVSIHQNSFTDSRSCGAQVFYYEGSEDGKRGAQILQTVLKRELADGNHRMPKANTSYYMLKKSPCPLVIVECGFLSNPEEEKMLQSPKYQRKLAWAIHLGVMEWLEYRENGKDLLDTGSVSW